MTPRLLLPILLSVAAAPACGRASLPPPAPARSPLADYVLARAAGDNGDLDIAARAVAAALADNPADTRLGLTAFRQALAAGDMALARSAAEALEARQVLPPDGTLLLLAAAVADKDYGRARLLAARVRSEKLFGFVAPVAEAWIAFGRHDRNAAALLAAPQPTKLAAAVAAEHRALLLLAGGKPAEGIAALNALELPDTARAARLRIAAAATLAARHKRDLALTLLTGTSAPELRARALLTAHRALPGGVTSAQTGLARLFTEVAAEINREQAAALALGFARMATMLAPQDSEARLLTASLLAGGGDIDAGLAALGPIGPDDPFAGAARDARVTLLVRAGRADAALADALAATREPDASAADWSRYADLLVGRERYGEAAAAYDKALALAGGARAPADLAWPLLLQMGNAQLESGDWPQAEATVKRALAIAPDQPAILNFLGYSQLEHGGDPAAASALIAKAAALAPDDPAITDSLGWSWYVRGDYARAIPLLEQAVRASPAESDINEHLGDAYWKVGRQLEARYAWRAALVPAGPKDAARLRAKIDNGLPAAP
ncbi:tetratricopeptide repeat protein [Sphingomonas morindae]|uniref:Tetratricopeptide repeat protein n=1 Tax=Sphingomonas morindae TaxID=1541170 RepID=A0ABY4X4S8_9SPHN|nr:tetratricopeptide repeat protein [Sphingomonas morindae]USI71876.1 tetratricopeptide repeat protein [Sphingomonas morindae]